MNYSTLIDLLQTRYKTANNRVNTKAIPADVEAAIRSYTAFLNYDASIITRVWYLLLNQQQQITCAVCNTPIRISRKVEDKVYHCSLKCSNNSQRVKQLKKESYLSSYGVDNPSKSPQVLEKMRATFVENYGVDNPSKSPEIKEKLRQINIDNAAQRMAAGRETMMQRYGCHISQLDSVKEKRSKTLAATMSDPNKRRSIHQQRQATCVERYGTANPNELPDIKQKIKDTTVARHGIENYNNRLQAAQSMNDRFGCHNSRVHYTAYTAQIINNKNALSEFVKGKTINLAASQLGISGTTLRSILLGHNIDDFSKRTNQYEAVIVEWCVRNNIEFETSNRCILGNLELDIVMPKHNVAVECNGSYWHSTQAGKTADYHLTKTVLAKQQGVELLHIWDYHINTRFNAVIALLHHATQHYVDAVDVDCCSTATISIKEYTEFTDKYSVVSCDLPVQCTVGVFYQQQLVAAAGFNCDEMVCAAACQSMPLSSALQQMVTYYSEMTDAACITARVDRDNAVPAVFSAAGFNLVDITLPEMLYLAKHEVFKQLPVPNVPADYLTIWNTGTLIYEFRR